MSSGCTLSRSLRVQERDVNNADNLSWGLALSSGSVGDGDFEGMARLQEDGDLNLSLRKAIKRKLRTSILINSTSSCQFLYILP